MNAKANILIVDDEEIVRISYMRSLSGLHCGIEAVGNGTEAVQAMAQRPFDVVLLDLRMPEMDGMTVLRTIKQKWPESEVVIITGYPAVESAKESMMLGAYAYLAKPVDPDDVINATTGAILQKGWTLRQSAEIQRQGSN